VSEVTVCLDDRARLVMAVLAASDWPEHEQTRERHAVHPHAKLTRHRLAPYRSHPAVTFVNEALQQGADVASFFAVAWWAAGHEHALAGSEAPPFSASLWLQRLADFERHIDLSALLWREQEVEWHTAVADLQAIFHDNQLAEFTGRLYGRELAQPVSIVPNLIYPALASILVKTVTNLYLILPPPKAFGESRPWPYGEGVDWVLAESCRHLAAHFLADELSDLGETQESLLLHAAATLFLEQALNQGEALSYLVRTKKQHKLPQLPAVTERLRRYLAAPNGRLVEQALPDG
jgi:hypothetical protein